MNLTHLHINTPQQSVEVLQTYSPVRAVWEVDRLSGRYLAVMSQPWQVLVF